MKLRLVWSNASALFSPSYVSSDYFVRNQRITFLHLGATNDKKKMRVSQRC